jgi:hypothetical protein
MLTDSQPFLSFTFASFALFAVKQAVGVPDPFRTPHSHAFDLPARNKYYG